MSPVYIFGGSAEHTITTNNLYITSTIKNIDFEYKRGIFIACMVLNCITDKKITLTYALLDFHNGYDYDNRELYWIDKQLRVINWDNTKPSVHINTKATNYNFSGSIHNVPYIKIPINKTIEANKNLGILLICDKTFPSGKPDDVILTDIVNPNFTPQQNFLPFDNASIKLYYNYI